MQRVDTGLSGYYGPGVLYIDDLERIYEIFVEHSKEVSLEADGYKFDDFEEFKAKTKSPIIKEFYISATTPHYMTLHLSRNMCRLYVGSSKTEPMGIFHSIEMVITARESKLKVFNNFWLAVTGTITAWALILLNVEPVATILMLVITFISVRLTYIYLVRGFWLINKTSKHDHKTFWSENRDKIVLAVFSAILGSILTLGAKQIESQLLGNPSAKPPASSPAPSVPPKPPT